MPYLYVHEKVADYARWRKVFDGLAAKKGSLGFIEAKVLPERRRCQRDCAPRELAVPR